MRTILGLVLLLTQPVLAAECFRVVDSPSRPQIILRGLIEHRPSSANPGAIKTFLKLSAPICIQGTASDGLPFKKENVESIQLGLPNNLLGKLLPLDRVAVRGELWSPALNDEPPDYVIFAVKDVL